MKFSQLHVIRTWILSLNKFVTSLYLYTVSSYTDVGYRDGRTDGWTDGQADRNRERPIDRYRCCDIVLCFTN